jgi:hypothetical protein
VLSNVPPTVPNYFQYYNHSSGLFSVRDVSLDFAGSNDPDCPIIEYFVQIELAPGVFTNFSGYGATNKEVYIANGGDNKLYLQSLLPYAPYEYTNLWVVAATRARNLDRYNFWAKICGAENFVDLGG